MPGQSTAECASSRRKSEPHSKLQRPPQPQDQGTDQLSRNKEAQDVTNQILALADERAYLLAMPKPSNETKAAIIAGLDNINFLNETLAKKDTAVEALEHDTRKANKKFRAQTSKFERLIAESKAIQNSNFAYLEKINERLKKKVERLEQELERGPRGIGTVVTILLVSLSVSLVYVYTLLLDATSSKRRSAESVL
ncbi:MAG: hypothetical protein Q9208_006585 [Pyrenodesmia sp. 3 TL-2023]